MWLVPAAICALHAAPQLQSQVEADGAAFVDCVTQLYSTCCVNMPVFRAHASNPAEKPGQRQRVWSGFNTDFNSLLHISLFYYLFFLTHHFRKWTLLFPWRTMKPNGVKARNAGFPDTSWKYVRQIQNTLPHRLKCPIVGVKCLEKNLAWMRINTIRLQHLSFLEEVPLWCFWSLSSEERKKVSQNVSVHLWIGFFISWTRLSH